MTEPSWSVELTRTAIRDLRRIDPPVRRRIQTTLATLTRVLPRGRAYRD